MELKAVDLCNVPAATCDTVPPDEQINRVRLQGVTGLSLGRLASSSV